MGINFVFINILGNYVNYLAHPIVPHPSQQQLCPNLQSKSDEQGRLALVGTQTVTSDTHLP